VIVFCNQMGPVGTEIFPRVLSQYSTLTHLNLNGKKEHCSQSDMSKWTSVKRVLFQTELFVLFKVECLLNFSGNGPTKK
jgi:hypothetical protein